MVTGAAGFIGSRLSHSLLDDGNEVVGVDSFTDAYDPLEKRERTGRLESRPGYLHIQQDVATARLSGALEGVEVVFHLAGRPGVRDSFRIRPQYHHDNVEATAHLVAEAIQAPTVRRLVYASSSSVYGDAELPLRETARPHPISPYGQTKLAAEELCQAASGPRLETVSLRYFTVYGPGQRPDMAFRRFVEAALLRTPITVYGDGTQTRDFTYVDDIVTATRAAADAAAAGMVINVGGGSRISINEVLELLGSITGTALDVERVEDAPGDVRHTSADLSRSRELLAFQPKTSVPMGLAAEVDWVRARLRRVGRIR